MREAISSPPLDALAIIRIMSQHELDAKAILSMPLVVEPAVLERFITPLATLAFFEPTAPNNFGSGVAGESALNAIKTTINCQSKEPCNEPPVLTLDFDIQFSAELDQIPLCMGHLEPAMIAIKDDLSKVGKNVSFGINGHGRA